MPAMIQILVDLSVSTGAEIVFGGGNMGKVAHTVISHTVLTATILCVHIITHFKLFVSSEVAVSHSQTVSKNSD